MTNTMKERDFLKKLSISTIVRFVISDWHLQDVRHNRMMSNMVEKNWSDSITILKRKTARPNTKHKRICIRKLGKVFEYWCQEKVSFVTFGDSGDRCYFTGLPVRFFMPK